MDESSYLSTASINSIHNHHPKQRHAKIIGHLAGNVTNSRHPQRNPLQRRELLLLRREIQQLSASIEIKIILYKHFIIHTTRGRRRSCSDPSVEGRVLTQRRSLTRSLIPSASTPAFHLQLTIASRQRSLQT